MAGCSSSGGDSGTTGGTGTTTGDTTGGTGTTTGDTTGDTTGGTGTTTGDTTGGTGTTTGDTTGGTGTTTGDTTGGTGTTTGGTEGSSDLSAIAGLWDVTEDIDGLEDVFYTEIFADGNIILWDYDGDEFDAGENCYFTFQITGVNLGNNRYNLGGDEVTMRVINNELVGSDAFGEFRFPRVTAFTSAEFNEC